MSAENKPVYQFGPFRLDVADSLLYRNGQSVPLTPKALETLLILVEKHGHVVEKQELMKRLWPETFVEEGSLTFNISVVRKALGDDRQNEDRYIETVPRRGYRFVATVVSDHAASDDPTAARAEVLSQQYTTTPQPALAGSEPQTPELRIPHHKSQKHRSLALLAATLTCASLFVYFLNRPLPVPTILGYSQITRDGRDKQAGSHVLTDGLTLYFPEETADGPVLAQVAISGGDTSIFHTSSSVCGLSDVSVHPYAALLFCGPCVSRSPMPVCVQPLPSGSPHRIGEVRAYGAGWSPDGQTIAYTGQQGIYLVDASGANSRKIATVPASRGVPSSSPRWSPEGKLLRFSVFDGPSLQYSLWEVSSDGSNLHEVLPDLMTQSDLLGNWTPDGKYFVFSLLSEGRADIWAIRGKNSIFRLGKPRPMQLTRGPMNYSSPLPSADGRRLFVIGSQPRGELVRWDSKAGEFVGFLGGISAHCVAFSRDGRWVAYLRFPEETLWRMRPDGSDARQLTVSPTKADGLELSPDGKQIAFRAKKPGSPPKISLISVQGGQPQELLPQRREEQGIPTWSPDGNQIAFGDVPIVFGHGAGNEVIHLYDRTTRELSSLPDSNGLWTSRWSQQGRYIAALTIARQELMIFDSQSGKWRDLGVGHVNSPTWSHDSKYIYFGLEGTEWNSGIFRVRISDGKLERVAVFNGMRRAANWWSGVARDDSPIVLRDIGTPEIYALDVEWP